MKLVAQVKLVPTSARDAEALAATLRACNAAANRASRVAWETGAAGRSELQRAVYRDLKAGFGLSAQPAVRVVKKTADAYATLKANLQAGNLGPEGSPRRRKAESTPIAIREDAAQPFDDRCLSWQLEAQTVSIWTVAGRLKHLPFACSPETLALLAQRRGESDLVMRDGTFYLITTLEVPEPPAYEPNGMMRSWPGAA